MKLSRNFQINLSRGGVEGDKVAEYLEGAVENLSEKLTEEDNGLLGLGILSKCFNPRKHSMDAYAVSKPGEGAEIERAIKLNIMVEGIGAFTTFYGWP